MCGITVLILVFVCFSFEGYCFKNSSRPKVKLAYPDFKNLVENDYYIDKSLLALEFFSDSHTFVYPTAPRSYGKTLNLLMLKHYFQIQVDQNGTQITDITKTENYSLFSKLKVFENRNFFKATFGKIPVIHVNYDKLISVKTNKEMMLAVGDMLLNSFKEHSYLLGVEKLWRKDLKRHEFRKYIDTNKGQNLTLRDLETGLCLLSKVLFFHFKRRAILVIDEYDTFAIRVMFGLTKSNELDSAIAMFESINKSVLRKSCIFVTKVFATGIFPIIGKGLTETDRYLRHYPFLQDHRYTSFYGIDEEELTVLLKKHNRSSEGLDEDIRRLYGGQRTLKKGTQRYCIASVIEYLKRRRLLSAKALSVYWTQPRPFYFSLSILLYSPDILNDLIILLKNTSVTVKYVENISKKLLLELKGVMNGTIVAGRHHLVHNVLLSIGFLTYQSKDGDNVTLQLPNDESKRKTRYILCQAVKKRFSINERKLTRLYSLIESVSETKCDRDTFERIYKSFRFLISNSKFSMKNDSEFETYLFSLFVEKLKIYNELVRYDDGSVSHFNLEIENVHGVSFKLEPKMFFQNSTLKRRQLKNCTMEAINTVIEKRYGENLDYKNRSIVFIGICLGLGYFGAGTKKGLGFAYSMNLIGNDLRSVARFVQKV